MISSTRCLYLGWEMSWFSVTGGRMTEWPPSISRATEPLQPGDPDEAEEGAPKPVPDPPDTDPIPEEEPEP